MSSSRNSNFDSILVSGTAWTALQVRQIPKQGNTGKWSTYKFRDMKNDGDEGVSVVPMVPHLCLVNGSRYLSSLPTDETLKAVLLKETKMRMGDQNPDTLTFSTKDSGHPKDRALTKGANSILERLRTLTLTSNQSNEEESAYYSQSVRLQPHVPSTSSTTRSQSRRSNQNSSPPEDLELRLAIFRVDVHEYPHRCAWYDRKPDGSIDLDSYRTVRQSDIVKR